MLDKPLFMLYNTSLDRNNKLFKDNLAKLLHGKGITYLGTRPSSVKNTKSFAFLTVKVPTNCHYHCRHFLGPRKI